MKLIFKVQEKATGRYRAFQRRDWPVPFYKGTDHWAGIFQCEDEYVPHNVRTGNHKPITIILFHHQHPNRGNSWVRLRMTKPAATLDEAKNRVARFLSNHPEFWPPDVK